MTDIFFDIMDTVVVDPYMTALPAFFGYDFATLVAKKDRTLWPKFERGEISEEVFLAGFFPDDSTIDAVALHAHLKQAYKFVPGMEAVLAELKSSGHALHAFTNYPTWVTLVEEALTLSTYLNWTVTSFEVGARKPDPKIYEYAMARLTGESQPWFIDDRESNVAAGREAGFVAHQFKDAATLRRLFVDAGLL